MSPHWRERPICYLPALHSCLVTELLSKFLSTEQNFRSSIHTFCSVSVVDIVAASVVSDKSGLKKTPIMSEAAAERMDNASATSHMRKLVPLIYIKRINISSGDAVTSRPLSQLANLPIHLNIGEEWECFSGLTLCTSWAREGKG